MFSFRILMTALALSLPLPLLGCPNESGDAPAPEAGGTTEEAPPADETPGADEAEQAAEPPAAEEAEESEATGETPATDEAPAPADAGGAAGDIRGSWVISTSGEDRPVLVSDNPEAAGADEAMREAMDEMMGAMLDSMSLTISQDKMAMTMAGETAEVTYQMEGDVITSTTPEGLVKTVTVSWDGDMMIWTRQGDERQMRWKRP
jgi:hypothetical protein